jgi:hypothetical protein
MPADCCKQKSEGISVAGESCVQLLYDLLDYVESGRIGMLSNEFGV